MTIRQKLLLSNIMIIVLPTLVVFLAGLFAFFLIFGVQGSSDYLTHTSRINYCTQAEAQGIIEKADYEQVAASVTVYRNDENDYLLVFDNEKFMPNTHALPYIQRHTFFLGVIIIALSIFFLNRLLAYRIMKGIVTPLNTLTNGVNEISNGNLDFRIEYTRQDEFTSTCMAFNEMAARLSDMTRLQQKEEQNRKVLIAGISHDLRTPLTSIKAYVVGLETGVAATPAMQKKYLSTINQKTNDLEYIIDQLFLFSKLDVGDFPFLMEQTNICELLQQMTGDLQDEYSKKGVSLVIGDMPASAICTIDAVQFGNVIQNIWSNTAKYKKNDSAVSTISAAIQGSELCLTVADNGPGVPSEALDKLFDIFYRTDTSRQNVSMGSGLGLAISAKIIHSFEGTICAGNLPGGGLCIEIHLPLSN